MTLTLAHAPPRVAAIAPALVFTFSSAFTLTAGESALTVADLAAYRAALSGRGAADRAPVPVGFRELWDHPATYQGRRVQVEGRVFRRFRQEAFGAFPPLEEAWTFSSAGDPLCLVFPRTPHDSKPPGRSVPVRFVGTFLKLVEYQGSDGARLAPLIVGPAAPAAVTVASDRGSRPAPVPGPRRTRLDWAIGLAAALAAALVLALQHLRRPVRRPTTGEDAPAPLFDDAIAPARVPRRSDLH